MHKTILIKYHLITAVLVLICLAGPVSANQTQVFNKVFEMHGEGRVYLNNTSGDIDIKTWHRDKIEIKARIISSQADLTDIEIKESDNTIWIRTAPKTDLSPEETAELMVHYQIHLPDQVSLKIKSEAGNIHVSGIGGSLDIRNLYGGINIHEAKGSVNCEINDGNIDLTMVAGDVRLRTVSGKINIGQVDGTLRIGTVNSNIVVNAISKLSDMEVKSISGDINITGRPPKNGIYEIKSFSGDITVGAFDDAGFELQARTMNGWISGNSDISKEPEKRTRKVKFNSGNGGATLRLSSYNGNININRVAQ